MTTVYWGHRSTAITDTNLLKATKRNLTKQPRKSRPLSVDIKQGKKYKPGRKPRTLKPMEEKNKRNLTLLIVLAGKSMAGKNTRPPLAYKLVTVVTTLARS